MLWWVGLLILLWALTFGPLSSKSGLRRIRRSKELAYQTKREMVPVDAADFAHLDLAFYEATTAALSEHGFRVLGDHELRPPLAGHRPLFIRSLVNDTGEIAAGLYNYQATGVHRLLAPPFRNLRVTDITSRLSNGSHVLTSNAYLARHQQYPPQCDVAFFQLGTEVSDLLDDHLRRVRAHLEADPELTVLRHETFEDLEAGRRELERLKAEFHARRGHDPAASEVRGIASDMKIPGARNAAEGIIKATKKDSRKD